MQNNAENAGDKPETVQKTHFDGTGQWQKPLMDRKISPDHEYQRHRPDRHDLSRRSAGLLLGVLAVPPVPFRHRRAGA